MFNPAYKSKYIEAFSQIWHEILNGKKEIYTIKSNLDVIEGWKNDEEFVKELLRACPAVILVSSIAKPEWWDYIDHQKLLEINESNIWRIPKAKRTAQDYLYLIKNTEYSDNIGRIPLESRKKINIAEEIFKKSLDLPNCIHYVSPNFYKSSRCIPYILPHLVKNGNEQEIFKHMDPKIANILFKNKKLLIYLLRNKITNEIGHLNPKLSYWIRRSYLNFEYRPQIFHSFLNDDYAEDRIIATIQQETMNIGYFLNH